MTQTGDLSDEELFEHAKALRLQGLHGDSEARRAAQALEAEARRRFSMATTLSAPLEKIPVSRRSWWRFW